MLAALLTPAIVEPGDVTNFEVQVSNPVANDLNLSTGTIFWLNDYNPENATKVPPFNPVGPFPTYEIPSGGDWYAQTFTVADTFL